MAAFEDPEEAFSHVAPMSAGRGFLHVYRLDESLFGHEIVVASSNNKAVENISREIPALDAVADDLEPPPRYFASIADRVFQGGSGRQEVEAGKTWGLAAAVLGSSANRRVFADGFWWDSERSMHKYLRGIVEGWDPKPGEGREGEKGDEDTLPQVLLLEEAPRDRADALARWRKARKRFREAVRRADLERQRLEAMREALHGLSAVEQELEEVRADLDTLPSRAAEVARDAEAAEEGLQHVRRRKDEAVADQQALQSLRPGLLARLFGTRRFRDWRDRMMAAVRHSRRLEAWSRPPRRPGGRLARRGTSWRIAFGTKRRSGRLWSVGSRRSDPSSATLGRPSARDFRIDSSGRFPRSSDRSCHRGWANAPRPRGTISSPSLSSSTGHSSTPPRRASATTWAPRWRC